MVDPAMLAVLAAEPGKRSSIVRAILPTMMAEPRARATMAMVTADQQLREVDRLKKQVEQLKKQIAAAPAPASNDAAVPDPASNDAATPDPASNDAAVPDGNGTRKLVIEIEIPDRLMKKVERLLERFDKNMSPLRGGRGNSGTLSGISMASSRTAQPPASPATAQNQGLGAAGASGRGNKPEKPE